MKRKKTDLILLHAPSVYDFRKKPAMFGPISDVVPSTSIFEMYPIGFMIMMGYLQKRGHRVRIINIALRMLKSKRFDVEACIKKLNPVAFGIDLHWLPHAQGSLALAEIIKKHHPETPVIFGGLSSSYFHEELIAYPQVDFVLRGDSIEGPLDTLLTTIKNSDDYSTIPNLTWKDSTGQISVNQLTHSPKNLDYYPFDYRSIIKSTVRFRDVLGHLPFLKWLAYPIVAMLPWRGCVHNCITCGGSAHFYNKHCGRKQPAYRSPDLVTKDIALVTKFLKGPIILLGELRQAGKEYVDTLFASLKKQRIQNHVAVELFYPAPKSYLQQVAEAVPNFNLEISPESHDEAIRKAFGRNYTNRDMEQTIEDALDLGCQRIDLFFMIGLAGQDKQSVMVTVDYCEYLLDKYASYGSGKVLPFISPLAPFLDPGSLAFENPSRYGFTLFSKTLEEHRQALLQPSWKYMLNYETDWMNRDQIVDATYEAAMKLNTIKAEFGIISKKEASVLEQRIVRAQKEIAEIDALVNQDTTAQSEAILKQAQGAYEPASICLKEELNWPFKLMRFNPISLFQALFSKQ